MPAKLTTSMSGGIQNDDKNADNVDGSDNNDAPNDDDLEYEDDKEYLFLGRQPFLGSLQLQLQPLILFLDHINPPGRGLFFSPVHLQVTLG